MASEKEPLICPFGQNVLALLQEYEKTMQWRLPKGTYVSVLLGQDKLALLVPEARDNLMRANTAGEIWNIVQNKNNYVQ